MCYIICCVVVRCANPPEIYTGRHQQIELAVKIVESERLSHVINHSASLKPYSHFKFNNAV